MERSDSSISGLARSWPSNTRIWAKGVTVAVEGHSLAFINLVVDSFAAQRVPGSWLWHTVQRPEFEHFPCKKCAM